MAGPAWARLRAAPQNSTFSLVDGPAATIALPAMTGSAARSARRNRYRAPEAPCRSTKSVIAPALAPIAGPRQGGIVSASPPLGGAAGARLGRAEEGLRRVKRTGDWALGLQTHKETMMQNVVFVGRLAADPQVTEDYAKAVFRLLETRGRDAAGAPRVVGV